MKLPVSVACLVLLTLANAVQAEQGNPRITAIEAIAFGPDGLLLIGGGARVISIETGDTKPIPWSKTEFPNIDQALAGKLGLQAKDIEVRKLAVNPASGKAYIALRSLKSKMDVILTVDGAGAIAEFELENVKHCSYSLAAPKASITKVTDIAWAGGKIVAATQATDKFSTSRVFTINPGAKDGAPAQISTKTYHIGHGRWETGAPLRVLMPYEEKGKTHVVGSFTCTPIVKYAVEDAKNGEQIIGVSVVDLGKGNTPRSMFAYERDGNRFILVNLGRNKQPAFGSPNSYWVARVDAEFLKETTTINEKAPLRGGGQNLIADRVQVAKDYSGAHHMDRLDRARALTIIESKSGFSLGILPLP